MAIMDVTKALIVRKTNIKGQKAGHSRASSSRRLGRLRIAPHGRGRSSICNLSVLALCFPTLMPIMCTYILLIGTSKICIVLVVVLLNKSCLVKLLELYYYISFVLYFLGPITWTSGIEHFLGPIWWIIDQVFIDALKEDFLYEGIVDNDDKKVKFVH
jgi:hypothetical protein